MRKTIIVATFLSLFVTPAFSAADKTAAITTERDFAHRLVETFGWSEGLPEKPNDSDYLTILEGKRSFKFEAEDCFDTKNDQVAVRNYPLFGKFTGSGWVHGSTSRSAVHFRVFIPIEGRYAFSAISKGEDQLWSIAGKAFKLDAGPEFKEKKLGEVFLNAGYLEFNAVIPPAGAIDSFSLTAHDLHPIEPVKGWKFSDPLTVDTVLQVATSLLGLEGELPEDKEFRNIIIEAASTRLLPPEAVVTDTQVYGRVIAGKWVRFPQISAPLSIPFTAASEAIYTVKARTKGEVQSIGFDGILNRVNGKPYLDWVNGGTFRLRQGEHKLTLILPVSGGVDVVEIGRKAVSPDSYALLTKLKLSSSKPLTASDTDNILKALLEQFKERK